MEEENVSQHIKDAFNAGDILQHYEPELLDTVLQGNDQKSEYVQVLVKGMQQHERERIDERQQKIREKSQQQTRKRNR